MKRGFYLSTVDRVFRWAQRSSLWFISTGTSCCADELVSAVGCKYDIERFGCVAEVDPRQADLLIITGAVTYKAAAELKATYDAMIAPKYVLAIGGCACGGGPFSPQFSYSVLPGADRVVPVDVYVPGCPPRPEAIMDGLIRLKERIRGVQEVAR